jgi:hypothetical protein
MIVTSSQREPLGFWPRPFEVKRGAKIEKKKEKIRKTEYFDEFFKKI